MKKYRRIEVNAFRRRVTITSGEWPRNPSELLPAQFNDEVSLNDCATCESVETDSPEGQLILLEAVRTIERRLSPEARATIRNLSPIVDGETEESRLTLRKGYDHEKADLINQQED